MRRWSVATAVGALVALTACTRGEASPDVRTPAARSAAVVDSILPVEEALRRFRTGMPTAPQVLEGGARTRDGLVAAFLAALARRDTSRLRALAITREEFAYLVYPESPFTREPYRTAPELVWMQVAENGDKGLRRLLRDDVQALSPVDYRCSPAPAVEGGNRLWRGCVVRARRPGGDLFEGRLFGVIIEREGRFKFVNLDTDF